MATSGVTAWSLTARDIITTALVNELAVIPIGEDPEAQEAALVLSNLNYLMKSATNGSHLESLGTVTIPANSASGSVAGDVQEVISARLVTGATERDLSRFERDEYLSIPNKAASGTPTIFYVSRQRDDAVMYVWPVPVQETTVNISYIRIPETITDLSQNVDFPSEYIPALTAMLAVRSAGAFGETPSPELVARANMLWREMEDNQRPVSYFMGAM